VAAALLATITRYRLPLAPLEALIDARRFDLYDEPMRTLSDLESYADGASSSLIVLAAHILAAGQEPDIGALASHAGRAQAIAGLLKAFPVHAARGQLYVPLEVLERHGAQRSDAVSGQATPGLRAALAEMRLIARRHLVAARDLIPAAAASVMPAFLPVAPTGPMLARMERRDYDPFVPVEIAQWLRQWLLWRAARRPRRIFG
jgi:15-cis-phytoene synthase